MTTPALSVRVTEVGEYVRHSSCQRRFRLERSPKLIGPKTSNSLNADTNFLHRFWKPGLKPILMFPQVDHGDEVSSL